jgi:tRNA pseudouridine38-40 synthase
LKAKDPEAKRYIMSFTVELFGAEKNFVKFNIEGQSFVYNQIRKMIGGMVFVFVNHYEP